MWLDNIMLRNVVGWSSAKTTPTSPPLRAVLLQLHPPAPDRADLAGPAGLQAREAARPGRLQGERRRARDQGGVPALRAAGGVRHIFVLTPT